MRPKASSATAITLALMVFLPLGCGDNGSSGPEPDTIPPGAVTDLSVSSTTDSSATLRWTAPGDDGESGAATAYDIRFSADSIATANWDLATAAPSPPTPRDGGSDESFIVAGLASETTYFFALKAVDDEQNGSGLSNVVRATTDETPPVEEPILAVAPDTLAFGNWLTVQNFVITNTGTGTLTWENSDDQEWLSVDPTSGSTTTEEDEIHVTVDRTGLISGEYIGTVIVTPGTDDARELAVSMTVVVAPPQEVMAQIRGGTFTMGSDEDEGESNERPEHTPSLSAFYSDVYEVTNAAYATALNWAKKAGLVEVVPGGRYGIVRKAGGSTDYLYMDDLLPPDHQCRIVYVGGEFGVEAGWDDFPVVAVTWFGAAAYCNWRSGQEARSSCYDTATWTCNFEASGYRLPTEAEWEKAARGSHDERTYPWGEGIDCGLSNYYGCAGTAAVEVANLEYQDGISPYGVWQMAGNVWEWCNDWYDASYYSDSPATDPRGPESGSYRVMRGGGWADTEDNVRCAFRVRDLPTARSLYLGFRAVRRP